MHHLGNRTAQVRRYLSIGSAATALNITRKAVAKYIATGKSIRGGRLSWAGPPAGKRAEVWRTIVEFDL